MLAIMYVLANSTLLHETTACVAARVIG